MTLANCFASDKVMKILNKVSSKSIEDHYNPYQMFNWPESLASDRLWMTPELMTTHGTAFASELTPEQLIALSKWESINFYSLNIHGIRELLVEVCKRIHTTSFALPSEFFHHFIEEENSHLWIFAQFCMRYGGKIYPERRMPPIGKEDPNTQQFMIFAKILIFEEVVDYFNVRMAGDESLHPLVREVNRLHHHDESRHIACSRELVGALYENLKASSPPEVLEHVEDYLKQYMVACIESLYNPSAYQDASLSFNAYQLRRALLADKARKTAHENMFKRTVSFFRNHGMFSNDALPL